ncbi:MAG: class I SAM-dependent methyltransferase [Dehalococcoidia bacterium]|nr:MAG: class I SAM-dependent methyltransferase [Dehalococcoidia bacterium]
MELMDKKSGIVDYGNWVAKKFIFIPASLVIIFSGLSCLSLFFLIGALFFIIPTIYFIYAYFQFSPGGGNLQSKIRDLIFNQLVWDGNGSLLDIDCGNGALAIEAAKKYSGARIVGIDYWGGQWEYSKETCEKNAQIAGVAEWVIFQKASAAKLPFANESFDAVVSNFVFHEVQDVMDKRAVIQEALRVLKKDGIFVFQDLFLWKRIYGEPADLLATIQSWGVREVKLIDTSRQSFIPGAMKLPFMVGQIGIIYGRK